MRFPIIALALITLIAEPTKAADPTACSIRELYNREGWEIPGLVGAKVSESRKVSGVLEGVKVDILEPKTPRGRLTLVLCVSSQPGRLELLNQPIEALSIWRYSRYGRVYAYVLTAGEMAIENGGWVASASETTVAFYDQDGSGKFTIMKEVIDPPGTVDMPAWVRQLRTDSTARPVTFGREDTEKTVLDGISASLYSDLATSATKVRCLSSPKLRPLCAPLRRS